MHSNEYSSRTCDRPCIRCHQDSYIKMTYSNQHGNNWKLIINLIAAGGDQWHPTEWKELWSVWSMVVWDKILKFVTQNDCAVTYCLFANSCCGRWLRIWDRPKQVSQTEHTVITATTWVWLQARKNTGCAFDTLTTKSYNTRYIV